MSKIILIWSDQVESNVTVEKDDGWRHRTSHVRGSCALFHTQVFLKEKERQLLLDTLTKEVMRRAIILQRWFRSCLIRLHFLQKRDATMIIQVPIYQKHHPRWPNRISLGKQNRFLWFLNRISEKLARILWEEEPSRYGDPVCMEKFTPHVIS